VITRAGSMSESRHAGSREAVPNTSERLSSSVRRRLAPTKPLAPIPGPGRAVPAARLCVGLTRRRPCREQAENGRHIEPALLPMASAASRTGPTDTLAHAHARRAPPSGPRAQEVQELLPEPAVGHMLLDDAEDRAGRELIEQCRRRRDGAPIPLELAHHPDGRPLRERLLARGAPQAPGDRSDRHQHPRPALLQPPPRGV